MVICIIVLVFGLALFFECIPLFRGGRVKEGVLYAGFLLGGCVILLLTALDVTVPSPVEPIRTAMRQWVVR